MNNQRITETLTTLISKKRFEHSTRVAKKAQELAGVHHLDIDKAYVCGLIHDCAKELSPTSSDVEYDKEHIALYASYPAVWHSFVIKPVCKYYFGDISEDVLDAAMYHTTGKSNMSDLQKIIFVADFLEPLRVIQHRDFFESLAVSSLDKAVFEVALAKLKWLLTSKLSIHPNLFDCYNFYCKLR